MNPLQPQYFPRTFLELEGDKKFVIIDHPNHGQHRFPLPTKEEIFKEYSYHSEPSKKKCLNSFMIFRTYLQKSKQSQNYLILSEVSKIASDAWSYATKDVLEACNELEEKLKGSFKNKIFVSYSPYPHQRPKKSKKSKSSSSKKKESSSPNTSSEEQVYFYPSPTPSMTSMINPPIINTPMINTPMINITSPSMTIPFPDPIYSYSPLSVQTAPICIIDPQQNIPLLALGPTLSSEEILAANSDQNQLSSLFPLTPSQIFCDFDSNLLGSGLTRSLELPDTNSFGESVTLNAVPWNFETILPEDEQNCILEQI